jgi:hypothetical protein
LRAVELEKPCYCNLKVVNNSEHHVAFKVRSFGYRIRVMFASEFPRFLLAGNQARWLGV